jgi:hypothetical protein
MTVENDSTVPGSGQLGDIESNEFEVALAALKGSAVFDREPQMVAAMEHLMAVSNAKIDELRVELDRAAPHYNYASV